MYHKELFIRHYTSMIFSCIGYRGTLPITDSVLGKYWNLQASRSLRWDGHNQRSNYEDCY